MQQIGLLIDGRFSKGTVHCATTGLVQAADLSIIGVERRVQHRPSLFLEAVRLWICRTKTPIELSTEARINDSTVSPYPETAERIKSKWV